MSMIASQMIKKVEREVNVFQKGIAKDDSADNVLDCLYELYEGIEQIISLAAAE